MRSMSDASMPFQPAIDDPSKAWPDSNLSSPTVCAGTDTCCSLPRVSVKRKSTNFTSLSLIIFKTSAGLAMNALSRVGVNEKTTAFLQIPCQARRTRKGATGQGLPGLARGSRAQVGPRLHHCNATIAPILCLLHYFGASCKNLAWRSFKKFSPWGVGANRPGWRDISPSVCACATCASNPSRGCPVLEG